MTRRLLVTFALVGALASSAHAYRYLAFEQVTVAAAAIGFTAATIAAPSEPKSTTAVCRLETAQIRYRFDGTDPTAAVGTPLEAGDVLTLTGHDVLVKFRGIRTGATSGVLNCTYSAQ